ncbi:MAG: TMEM175 family protein [Saprospiraceae bacterium]
MSTDHLNEIPMVDGVRLRGIANTRLDTFVDAAFAFGGTVLLISSGDLPSTYSELIALLKDIPAFTLSFFTMMIFWLSHRTWSRNYGIEDKVTIPFTLLLVVALLIYIYPLKLMYSTLLSFMSGGFLPAGIQISAPSEGVNMIGFYGLGFAILSFTMLGLYYRTYVLRDRLKFNALEVLEAKVGMTIWSTLLATGLLSGSIALFTPFKYAVWAGMCYWLLAPGIPFLISRTRKKYKREHKKTST